MRNAGTFVKSFKFLFEVINAAGTFRAMRERVGHIPSMDEF